MPRQMYGLGSLVKKAVKGVKNVIKSPIGKAAIAGAIGFGIPGTSFGGVFGKGALSGLIGKAGMMRPGQGFGGGSGLMGLFSNAKNAFTGLGTASKIFAGGAGIKILSDLFPQEEGEDPDTYKERLSKLEPLLDRYYKNVNRNASPGEIKDFITANTQEYMAKGGRVGYRLGGDTMDREGIKSLEAGAPDVKYTGDMRLASETGPEEFELDLMSELMQAFEEAKRQGFKGDFKSFLDMYMGSQPQAPEGIMQEAPIQMAANGGRIGFAGGTTLRSIASTMNDGRGPITRGDYIEIYELAGYDSDVAGSLGTEHYKTGFAQDDVVRQIGFATGGRVGFKDGSSTGNFGTDRYLSEMLESGSGLFNRGEDFFNKYKDMVKEGKLDSRMFDMLKEYKTLEKEAETTDDKFQNIDLIDKAEETLDKDALKYYDKKFKDLEKQEDDLTKQEEGIIALEKKTNFDASEITKTPDFQNWLRVYNSEDKMKAFDHPNVDIYLGVLGVKLKGRDENYDKAVKFADGGRIGLMKGAMPMDEDEEDSYRAGVMSAMMGRKKVMGGGMMEMPTGIMRMNQGGVMERDYRDQGGFVPVGVKEKADDVPAMLSKNEFVMTADAVRAAGGGSVQKGAQKMYNTMKSLERKVV